MNLIRPDESIADIFYILDKFYLIRFLSIFSLFLFLLTLIDVATLIAETYKSYWIRIIPS